MPIGDYLTGVAFFGVTFGAALVTAVLIQRARLRHLTGAACALALAILVTTALFVIHILPGLLGVLSRESAALAAVTLLAAAAWTTRGALVRRPISPTHWARLREFAGMSGDRLPGALAVAGLGLVAAWSAAAAWVGTVTPSTDVDTLTFHLPNVAKWIQTGTVWRTDQFIPLLSNGNYPHSGDVVMLAAVLPWESDAFVRTVGLPFAAICGLAVYALAREAGSKRAPAVAFAAVVAALPVFLVAAYEGAKTDVIMLAMFGAGAYFLLRSLRDRERSSLILAGLALGLALGTKWYALWSVPIVVAVWAGARLLSRRPLRQVAAQAAGLAGLVAVVGGVWMLRNWVESGSPIYPSGISVLGVSLFDVPRDFVRECAGFTIAGYLDQRAIFKHFLIPAFWEGYGAPGVVLGLGWLVAAGMVVRRLRDPARRDWNAPAVSLVAAVPLLVIAYSITPYSAIGAENEPFAQANLRWLLPALMLAAAASAWALSNLGAWTRALLGLGVLVATVAGVRSAEVVPLGTGLAAAVAVALGACLVGGLVVLWQSGPGARRALSVAGASIVLGIALVVGNQRQKDFYEGRYAEDPVLAVLGDSTSNDRKVGLAGVWTGDGISPILPAFGPRLRREVGFVGPMVNGQLREYPSRAGFLAAIREGGYDLMVVGRGTAAYGGCPVPGSESDEDAWLRDAGFSLVAQTHRLSLYEVPTALSRPARPPAERRAGA